MKKLNLFRIISSLLIITAFIVCFQPRKCKEPEIIIPTNQNYDSIKDVNRMLWMRVMEKNLEISKHYNTIDSLEKLKSKIIYKTKVEIVEVDHDSCKKYFKLCTEDLEIEMIENIYKDSIIQLRDEQVDSLIIGNIRLSNHLVICANNYENLNTEVLRLNKKVTNRNKIIKWLSGFVLVESAVLIVK